MGRHGGGNLFFSVCRYVSARFIEGCACSIDRKAQDMIEVKHDSEQ